GEHRGRDDQGGARGAVELPPPYPDQAHARMVAPRLTPPAHSPGAITARSPHLELRCMQRLSIARSLRLALVAMTLALALVAALGIAGLYNARERYENRLIQISSLATADANLAGAALAKAEVLREARGPTAAAA